MTACSVLLGSGGYRTPQRVERLSKRLREHFGRARRIIFVPYALADHDQYLRLVRERGVDGGYELVGIHTQPDPVRAIEEADGVYVGGGNTFRLLRDLYANRLLDPIRARVAGGMPYFGVSAGCNVAGLTIRTTNDMPIVSPPSMNALGLVPFQVNPHYFSGQSWVQQGDSMHAHFGETRDDRIREYHEENDVPVVGLWEADFLHHDGTATRLDGRARIFRRGQTPVDAEGSRALLDLK